MGKGRKEQERQAEEARIRSRRRFLIGGGATLASLGLGIALWPEEETKKKEEPYKLPQLKGTPKGDWSHEISQAEVNRTYHEIYNKIKDAKDNNKTGKPLAIVVAEGHSGTIGLINQLIIVSAAKRLGVNLYAAEDTPADIEKFLKEASPLRSQRKQAIETVNGQINPRQAPRKASASATISDAFLTLTSVQNKASQVYIPTFVMVNTLLKGNTIIGMDPKKWDIDPAIREPEMIKTLGEQTQDYIVATGGMHAANVAKGLKEKGQAVLLIDAMDKTLLMSNANEDVKKRYTDLQAMRDVNMNINGKPPATINELFAHAAVAEFAFDFAKDPGFQAIAKQAIYANLQIEQPARGR